MDTPADWLISIGGHLERFKREDAARAALHDSHVLLWMDDLRYCYRCDAEHLTWARCRERRVA